MTRSVGLVIGYSGFQNSGKCFHLAVYCEKVMIKDIDEPLDGGDAQGKVWGRGAGFPCPLWHLKVFTNPETF